MNSQLSALRILLDNGVCRATIAISKPRTITTVPSVRQWENDLIFRGRYAALVILFLSVVAADNYVQSHDHDVNN